MATNSTDIALTLAVGGALAFAVYTMFSASSDSSSNYVAPGQVCRDEAGKDCSAPIFGPDSIGPIAPGQDVTAGQALKIFANAVAGAPSAFGNIYDEVKTIFTQTDADGKPVCVLTSQMNTPVCQEPAETAGPMEDTKAVATFNSFLDGLNNQAITKLANNCYGNVTIKMPDGTYKTMVACDTERDCYNSTVAFGMPEVCAIYGGTGQGKTVTVLNGIVDAAPVQDIESTIYQNLGTTNYAEAIGQIDYTKYGTTINYSNVGVQAPVGQWAGPSWFTGNPSQCSSTATYTQSSWNALSPIVQSAIQVAAAGSKKANQGVCFKWQ